MTPCRSLYSRLLGRSQSAARLEEELALHVEFLAADHLRRGMSPSEARAAALRELGNRTAIKEQYHERSGFPLLERVVQDFKYSLRSLRHDRAFSIPSLAVLAVGFGAMITVLSVVSATLWSPLPYPESNRLVAVNERDPAGGSWPFSEPSLLDLQQQTHALEAVAGIRRAAVTLTGQGTPENLKIASVSPSFFPLFGVRPIAGRVFAGPAKNSLVITKALWIRKWHRLPSLIGRSVKLDDTSYIVTGIVDRPTEMLPGVDALTPLDPVATTSRSQHEIEVFGRLAQGWKDTQLTAELQSIGARIARENAKKNQGWSITATPLFDYLIGPRTRKMLWLILVGVALVWLLACANVASLQLARRLSRAREFATRAALGASRGRLLAQAFVESAVLALISAQLGLLVATWAIHLLRGVAGNAFPRLAGLHPDLKSLAAAFVALLLSTLFFGLLPGRKAIHPSQRGMSSRAGGRDLLMILQVALACILTLSTCLLLQTFLRLLSPMPGILAVGASNVSPFSGVGTANGFRLEGDSLGTEYRSAPWRAVTPGFLHAMHLALEQGRFFTGTDQSKSLQVVVVTRSFARQYWPGQQDVLGKRILWGSAGRAKTVVGVVADLRDLSPAEQPRPTIFLPFEQLSDAPMTALIRFNGNSPPRASDIRQSIWNVDPQAPVELQPLSSKIADRLFPERGTLQLMSCCAFLSMLIAAFGLYGLVSYRVSQKRLETGIRLALGASVGAVRWSVHRRALILVSAGLALGLPAAYGLSRIIRSLLEGSANAPYLLYLVVGAFFLCVAMLASHFPARYAAGMEPALLIRHDP